MKKQVWLAGGGLLLLAAAIVPFVLPQSPPKDPTAKLRRTLKIERARLTPAGDALEVRGTTNLVDDAKLSLTLLSGSDRLWSRSINVSGGAFSFREAAQGALSGGSYELEVRFDLAGQTKAVAEALSYQPTTLSSRATFQATSSSQAVSAPRNAVLELVDRVSQAKPADLARLDLDAQKLDASLWIATEKAALRTLRQAIAEAKKSRPDRQAFERLLLKAHAQAGK